MGKPITTLEEVGVAQPDAWRYRVKGAPDGKWHYVDNPELARRIIAVREEDGLGGYLYEIEPLAVMSSGEKVRDEAKRPTMSMFATAADYNAALDEWIASGVAASDGWQSCIGCPTPNDCRKHGCGVTRGLWRRNDGR